MKDDTAATAPPAEDTAVGGELASVARQARPGYVLVEVSGHIVVNGKLRLPGAVVEVTPDKAASMRWSGYAKPDTAA